MCYLRHFNGMYIVSQLVDMLNALDTVIKLLLLLLLLLLLFFLYSLILMLSTLYIFLCNLCLFSIPDSQLYVA